MKNKSNLRDSDFKPIFVYNTSNFVRYTLFLQPVLVAISQIFFPNTSVWFIITIDILISYLFSAFLLKKVLIYSHTIIIHYSTRFTMRTTKLYVTDIIKAKRIHGGGHGDIPEFWLYTNYNKFPIVISITDQKKDKAFLNILNDNNIDVVIFSRITNQYPTQRRIRK